MVLVQKEQNHQMVKAKGPPALHCLLKMTRMSKCLED